LKFNFKYKECRYKMDNTSYFIENKALFGSYPTKDQVAVLREHGVKVFVDVTNDNDHLISYKDVLRDNDVYINFPIDDRHYPENSTKFIQLLLTIREHIQSLRKGEKIYVHCKGGHGRAGVMVACLLCLMHNIRPEESLRLTNEYHSNRETMKDKWRLIGSPQTRYQKVFIFRMFKELYFFKNVKNSLSYGLSTFSEHPIAIKNYTFPNVECAYHALKHSNDDSYMIKFTRCTPTYAKKITRGDYKDNAEKTKTMKKLCLLKIKTHPEIKEVLIQTNLRPIIFTGKDSFWGGDTNTIGKIWMDIRFDLIKNYK